MFSTVYCFTLRGWPEWRQQVQWIAIHFLGTWDELSIDASLLLKGTRVYIPQGLLNCTLADLHGAHQGMDRMQAQVREAVYLPSIDADIVDYVHQCAICTKHKASPPTQPMLPRDVSNGPWQEITANYLTHKGKEFLLVWDLFGKYPSCIRSPQSQPNPYVHVHKSSSCSMDLLVCSTLTMVHPSHLIKLHSSCSATI